MSGEGLCSLGIDNDHLSTKVLVARAPLHRRVPSEKTIHQKSCVAAVKASSSIRRTKERQCGVPAWYLAYEPFLRRGCLRVSARYEIDDLLDSFTLISQFTCAVFASLRIANLHE